MTHAEAVRVLREAILSNKRELFLAEYTRATKTSLPDNYFQTALMAKQWECELTKSLAATESAGEWLPIECAPKDGRQIIAYGDINNDPCLIFFCDGEWHYSTDANSEFENPTVWHPLPPKPEKDTP